MPNIAFDDAAAAGPAAPRVDAPGVDPPGVAAANGMAAPTTMKLATTTGAIAALKEWRIKQ